MGFGGKAARMFVREGAKAVLTDVKAEMAVMSKPERISPVTLRQPTAIDGRTTRRLCAITTTSLALVYSPLRYVVKIGKVMVDCVGECCVRWG